MSILHDCGLVVDQKVLAVVGLLADPQAKQALLMRWQITTYQGLGLELGMGTPPSKQQKIFYRVFMTTTTMRNIESVVLYIYKKQQTKQ